MEPNRNTLGMQSSDTADRAAIEWRNQEKITMSFRIYPALKSKIGKRAKQAGKTYSAFLTDWIESQMLSDSGVDNLSDNDLDRMGDVIEDRLRDLLDENIR